MIRQPIVSIMGHVDHGKTSVLDRIRGSAVASREAGGITQAIGASIIPLETIKKLCGPLLGGNTSSIKIPGLLFIDTPGHAAFTNLRKRGGNLADIAIVVVDVNEGLQPQTIESLNILKQYKTPFLVAANKIDMIQGWPAAPSFLMKKIEGLSQTTVGSFEAKLYQLVAQLNEHAFNADRFDRVTDYTAQLAVVPISAKTGDGFPELLMVLIGLTQKYLEARLALNPASNAKGTVLEVKEEQGLGTTVDVILYEGTLHVGDTLVLGGMNKPVVTRVKSLLEPPPLTEMREKKVKYKQVKEAMAATGIKIAAPDMLDVVAGMPLLGLPPKSDTTTAIAEVMAEVQEVTVQTEKQGIIIKADSLGSLEALAILLREQKIPIARAGVGPITKKDISDAEASAEQDPLLGMILSFNVIQEIPPLSPSISALSNTVIYRLIEDYLAWRQSQQKKVELLRLDKMTKPAKIQLLKGYVFRQSNPAICGVDVVLGTLGSGVLLMNKNGERLTQVRGIQKEQENVNEAAQGARVAVSMSDVIIGRQIQEGDTLYTMLTEEEFRTYKELKDHLKQDQKDVLREIAEIMREKNPVWGI